MYRYIFTVAIAGMTESMPVIADNYDEAEEILNSDLEGEDFGIIDCEEDYDYHEEYLEGEYENDSYSAWADSKYGC